MKGISFKRRFSAVLIAALMIMTAGCGLSEGSSTMTTERTPRMPKKKLCLPGKRSPFHVRTRYKGRSA